VSFQITLLKVLAGHPDGRASVADLRHFVGILMTSGSDWTERMNGLAARVPDLDIVADGFVRRDENGWQITDAGREFLIWLETPTSAARLPRMAHATVPKLRLVVDNTRWPPLGPGPNQTRRSA
jgi:hypothetical protein